MGRVWSGGDLIYLGEPDGYVVGAPGRSLFTW